MNSNIRKLRNEKNISQTALADVIGKTQQTVSHMERDRDRISIESLIILADYFGVSTDYILGVGPKGISAEKADVKTGLSKLNDGRILSGADDAVDFAGENKNRLYQLILSLLLYSLEDDATKPLENSM